MTKTKKTLYIIDGHAHIYSAYYAPMRPLTSPTGEPTKATYIFTYMILGLLKNDPPDMLVVAMDSKTKTFRSDIFSDYKAHRPPMPDDMPAQIDRIEQILNALGVPILRIDRYEADDIIGTLAAQASKAGIETAICSKDKDMLQLLDSNTYALDIKTGKRTTPETLMAESGVTPAQFLEVLALTGDTADNIPGVADVGPKTALGWIAQYGSIENLYNHADEIKGRRGDSLRASRDVVKLSKELVTIDCNAPVTLDQQAFAVKPFDKDRLTEIFTELDFKKLLTHIGTEPADTGKTEKPNPSQTNTAADIDQLDTIGTTKHEYITVDTEEALEKLVAELNDVSIFAFDTETTSIRAMAAELAGMSFSYQPHRAFYIPVKCPMTDKCLDFADIKKAIAPIMADTSKTKVGQNIKYDLLVMENAGFDIAGPLFDTMVASYCLAAERASNSMDNMAADYLNYNPVPISELIGTGKNQITFDQVPLSAAGEYAAEDADITWQLYEYLSKRLSHQPEIEKLFYELEMPLVRVLTAIERNGVAIDIAMLKKMAGEFAQQIDTVSEQIYSMAGEVFNISSPKQLGDILFDKLGLVSKKTGKTGKSTDAGVLDELKGAHPVIDLVIRYRQLTKLKNTYLDKLGAMVNHRTNRLHASFNQTITATGRLSSSDPNLQNIPIRTDEGKKIRSAFIAGKADSVLISADYSQIELRILAHLSGDKNLTKAFADDTDIHSFVASQVFGVPLSEVTPDMRSRSKAVNFGIIYGQGAYGLSQSTGMTMTEAKTFIDDYFKRYSSIRAFMNKVIKQTKDTGYAQTIMNRRRRITGLDSRNHNIRSQAERMAVNTVIQGSAADLIKLAMINIQRKIEDRKLDLMMILQIHDELVFEAPESNSAEYAKMITAEMSSAMTLDVPLKVDTAIGKSWLI